MAMSDVEKVQWRELRKCSLCPLPMRKLRRAAQKIGSSITIAPPAHDHENTLTFRGHFQNASWRTPRNGNGEGLSHELEMEGVLVTDDVRVHTETEHLAP